jgi:hypothetical protein
VVSASPPEPWGLDVTFAGSQSELRLDQMTRPTHRLPQIVVSYSSLGNHPKSGLRGA